VKRNVFSCLLKEAREVAVVTLVGRLFHARAVITQKDGHIVTMDGRLPVIEISVHSVECCYIQRIETAKIIKRQC